jgi:Leucine-rich repeat (LRR) protein
MKINRIIYNKAFTFLLVVLLIGNSFTPMVSTAQAAEKVLTSIELAIDGDGVSHAFGDESYEIKHYKKISLQVTALYSDGTTNNVTNESTFTSSEESIMVNSDGTVTGTDNTKGTITATYQTKQASLDVNSNWDYVSGSYALNLVGQPNYGDLIASEVDFLDRNLEKAVRNQLNKQAGTLTKEDMSQLTSLDASYRNIQDLSGLQFANNLVDLTIEGNEIISLTPLQNLTSLKRLWLGDNQVTDIGPLSSLSNLTELYAWDNQLTSVEDLSGLTNLVSLHVNNNEIMNLSPLSNLTGLVDLELSKNQIVQVEALEALSQLQNVNIKGNPLSADALSALQQLETTGATVDYAEYDTAPIEFADPNLEKAISEFLEVPTPIKKGDLKDVQTLDLSNKGITNLQGLENAADLTTLYLNTNSITNIDTLLNLSQLNWVEISRNPIAPESLLTIQTLETSVNAVYVTYDLEYDPTPVEFGDSNLEDLLSNMFDLTKPVARGDLSKIDYLFLTNEKLTSLKGLEHATNLIGLSVWGNRLTSISELKNLEFLQHLDITKNPVDVSEGSEALSIIQGLEAKEATVLYDIDVDSTPIEFADPNLGYSLGGYPNVPLQFTKGDVNQLESLNLQSRAIIRLDGLEHAASLKTLYLGNNQISDLSPLASLNRLSVLYLNNNDIKDLTPLLGLSNLSYLNIKNNLFDASTGSPAREIISRLQAKGVTVLFNQQPDTIVSGKVLSENTSFDKYSYVSVSGNAYSYSYQTKWNASGDFSFKVGEGSYTLTGVTIKKIYPEIVPIKLAFEIREGKLYVGGKLKESLEVELPAPSLKGSLVDENGIPVADASVQVNGINGESSSLTDSNGNFGFRLADGKYTLTHIIIGNESAPQNLSFEIKEGQLYINGELKEQLEIKLLPVSLTGTLLNEDGQIAPYTSIQVYSENMSPIGIPTDSLGEFSYRLADGFYKISYSGILIQPSFEIREGKLYVNGELHEHLEVKIPSPSLKGRIVDENGTKIANANVLINGNNQWFWAYADAQGNFQYRMNDGTYKIDRIETGNSVSPQNIAFEIKDGKLFVNGEFKDQLEIKLPPVTLTGKLVDENGQILSNTRIQINSDTQGYSLNTDSYGQFGYRLEDGAYRVSFVTIGDETISLNIPFEIKLGKLYVKGELKELLVVEMPAFTLNGHVVDENVTPVANADVTISGNNHEYRIKTDLQGKFSSRLADGTYKITNITIGNVASPQNVTFEIKEGKQYVNGQTIDQLEIKLSPVTVKGKLIGDNGQTVSNTYIQIDNGYQSSSVLTNSEGQFGYRLENGTYRVSYVSFGSEGVMLNIPFEIKEGKLYVNGVLKDNLEVGIPPITFKGSIKDSDDSPVNSGYLSLFDYKNRKWYNARINSDGTFYGRFSDGNFLVYMTNNILLNHTFSIVNGKMIVNGQIAEIVDLKINSVSTISAILKENGLTIPGKSIYVGYQNGLVSSGFKTDSNGIMKISLQNGLYHIYGVEKDNQYMAIKRPIYFEIKDGKLFVSGFEQQTLLVEMNPQKPVLPTGLKIEAKEKNALHLQWDKQDTALYYKIYRSLTVDGVYEEIGAVSMNEYVDRNLEPSKSYWYKIIAVNAEGESESTEASLGETKPEVSEQSGKLLKGSEPLANVTFSLYSTGETQVWYDFRSDVHGVFTYDLPDGEYKIDGIWVDPTWYVLNKTFTVQDGVVNGELLELNVSPVKVPTEPGQPNVVGTLLNGSSPFVNLPFSIHSLDGTTWYDATTDSTGEFSFVLPDGTYQVDGIWVDAIGKWYELNQQFIVKNGQLEGAESLEINVNPLHYNVFGTLFNGTNILSNIIFNIRTVAGEEIWYDTQTDKNGHFGFKLPDGAYLIGGVWDDSAGKWYELNQTFTVKDGQLADSSELVVNVKPTPTAVNVVGTLQKGAEALSEVVFSIRTTSGAEIWYDTKTDQNGRFGFSLPDGSYLIGGIWVDSTGEWFDLNQSFTVKDGQLDGASELLINVKPEAPSFNVVGTLQKGTESLSDVIFSIRTATGTEIWYDTKTDQNGRFGFNLPDGSYVISGIWVDATGEWFDLNQTFSVKDAQLEGSAELLINVKPDLPSFNVVGTLKKGTESLSGVNFSIHTTSGTEIWYDAQTDQNGQFGFNLPDGSYMLEGIWVETEGKWYSLQKEFTVSGELQLDIVIE